jgi:hypothetical protein
MACILKTIAPPLQETGKSQWDHPLAGAVVYGVAVHGSSDISVKLRRFIRETGWIDIEARLKKESFASDIKVFTPRLVLFEPVIQ